MYSQSESHEAAPVSRRYTSYCSPPPPPSCCWLRRWRHVRRHRRSCRPRADLRPRARERCGQASLGMDRQQARGDDLADHAAGRAEGDVHVARARLRRLTLPLCARRAPHCAPRHPMEVVQLRPDLLVVPHLDGKPEHVDRVRLERERLLCASSEANSGLQYLATPC
jgi:hypothetical protein